MAEKKSPETPAPKRQARTSPTQAPEEPPLLQDRRFRAALVFLTAVIVFSAGYLVGHAAGSSDGSSDDGTIVVGSDDDTREGYIGVVGTDARRREGALILEVLPGSPAERAGLARGDLVMTAGDFDITSMRALARAIRATAPGRAIELGLVRGDRRLFVEVEVARQPTDVLGPPEQFPPPHRPGG